MGEEGGPGGGAQSLGGLPQGERKEAQEGEPKVWGGGSRGRGRRPRRGSPKCGGTPGRGKLAQGWGAGSYKVTPGGGRGKSVHRRAGWRVARGKCVSTLEETRSVQIWGIGDTILGHQ